MYQLFINEVQRVLEIANKIYNTDVKVTVKVDIRGTRIAGQAMRKNGVYYIRLNPLFCEQSAEHMMTETIPHEVAHIIAFALKCDDGHGPKWTKIAKSLGCTGNRCHNERVYKENETYYFAIVNDHKVQIRSSSYDKIQKGVKFKCKYGKIDKDTEFEIKTGKELLNVKVKDVKEETKTTKFETKTEVKTKSITSKIEKKVPRPGKKSMEIFVKVKGDFELFSVELEGKTLAYIKSEYKRASYHHD